MDGEDSIPRIRIEPRSTSSEDGQPHPPDFDRQTIRIGQPGTGEEAASQIVPEEFPVLRKIADGGMGVVYLAKDTKLGRHVAVKRLNRTALNRPALKERFLREAKSVAVLNHIHIVHIYALGEDKDGPYIVMEYIPGPSRSDAAEKPAPPFSLADCVQSDGPLPVDEAVDLAIKLCSAVEYAHTCGVIHRDLKPSNVLLDESREPKIIDFGLARKISEAQDKLTVPGEKMLSLGYGAPEQEKDASTTDERADIYGLGAILYFSITGQNPRYFRENDVPESVRMPIVKALQTDRDKRWRSAVELREALTLVKAPSTVEIPTAKTSWRCKWCDTVNPMTIPYCGECGWDGREFCAECDSEIRVGVQFCGECGADAREYETATRLLERLRRHKEEKSYEKIVEEPELPAFQPIGPNGRKMVRRIKELREEAQKVLLRRQQLIKLIKDGLAAEHFETARNHIKEYRALTPGNPYSKELEDLPDQIIRRDMRRARKAMARGEWDYAVQVAEGLLPRVKPGDPEAQRLLRAVRRHQRRMRVDTTLVGLLVALLFYVLSAAPVARFLPEAFHGSLDRFYAGIRFLHRRSLLQAPLEDYAHLWGARGLFGQPATRVPPLPSDALAARSEQVATLSSARDEYLADLEEIEADYRQKVATWPGEYSKALETLMEKLQKAGDFEGWEAVREERERFTESKDIPDASLIERPVELAGLQHDFQTALVQYALDKSRKTVARTKKYLNDLAALQKEYTKAGLMEVASAINDEIKSVKASDAVLEAEAIVADHRQEQREDEPAVGTSVAALPTEAEKIDALASAQTRYEQALADIDNTHAQKVSRWAEAYTEALQGLMERLQRAGDFEGWEAARQELERFDTDGNIPEDVLIGSPAELYDIQLRHIDMRSRYLLEKSRQVVFQSEAHIRRLQALQKQLTMQNKMDEALVVNTEIKRVKSSPEVTAAEAVLREEPLPEKPPAP